MLTTAYRIIHGEPLKTTHSASSTSQIWGDEMMAYVHRRWIELKRFDINPDRYPYPVKKTHVNHPMCVWVRTSRTNFFWVCQYAMELCKEHERRPLATGKLSTPHMYRPHIEWVIDNLPSSSMFPAKGFTTIPLCMDNECKHASGDPVLSYRAWVAKKYSTIRVIKSSSTPKRTIDWIRSPHRKPIWLAELSTT